MNLNKTSNRVLFLSLSLLITFFITACGNEYYSHVQLFNAFSGDITMSGGRFGDGYYAGELGYTGYYILSEQKGTEAEKKEQAYWRTRELAEALLYYWDKTGENPLKVLNEFDKSDKKRIDSSELIEILRRTGHTSEFRKEQMEICF